MDETNIYLSEFFLLAEDHEGTTKHDCINKKDHILYNGECIDFENAILTLNLEPDFYDMIEEYKMIGNPLCIVST